MAIQAALLLLLAIFGAFMQSCKGDDVLLGGASLVAGQYLSYGSFTLTMQQDCNLVLYDANNAIWASGTNGQGSNCYVVMQNDANLVVYSSGGAVWASNTQRDNGNYVLVLQNDRNLVIYGGSIWATGTNNLGRKMDPGSGKDDENGAIVVVNSKGESIGSKIEMVTGNK